MYELPEGFTVEGTTFGTTAGSAIKYHQAGILPSHKRTKHT